MKPKDTVRLRAILQRVGDPHQQLSLLADLYREAAYIFAEDDRLDAAYSKAARRLRRMANDLPNVQEQRLPKDARHDR